MTPESPTDTPRTDAVTLNAYHVGWDNSKSSALVKREADGDFVEADFARTLERELAAAHSNLESVGTELERANARLDESRAQREEAEKRIAAWILAVEQTTGTPKEDWGQHQDALTFLLNWFESHKQSLMERASLAESDASQTADQNNLIQETLKSRCAELAALKAAKEEAEAVAGQRYHYALNEPILKARIEELSQDRDVCLVRAEKAEAEVARLKDQGRVACSLFDELKAAQKHCGSLQERVSELEGALRKAHSVAHDAPELNMGNYDDAQVSVLNDSMIEVFRILKAALANREAAQQTLHHCNKCGGTWIGEPGSIVHFGCPAKAAQPSDKLRATQGEQLSAIYEHIKDKPRRTDGEP